MWTVYYKGMFINGYSDRDECTVIGGKLTDRKFKSFRAAQIAITKAVKGN